MTTATQPIAWRCSLGCGAVKSGPSTTARRGRRRGAAPAFQPVCLLRDIARPRMDGSPLARRIRQQPELSRAKLVALSAYSSEEHRQRVHEAGFDHALVKPADPTELEGLLKML